MKRVQASTERPVRPPTHPGAILREDVLPALQLSVSETARRLGVSRQTLHRIMAEKTSITPEMAVRLGRFCGNGPGLWLRMQQACDLWRAERRLRGKLAKITLHAEAKARSGLKVKFRTPAAKESSGRRRARHLSAPRRRLA